MKVHRFCHLEGAVREKPFELTRPQLWSSMAYFKVGHGSSLVNRQLTTLTWLGSTRGTDKDTFLRVSSGGFEPKTFAFAI